jgi:hypothetical protein
MAETVSDMTTEQLKALIEATVEQKLIELLGDPDVGWDITEAMRERLASQQAAVAAGERGEALDDLVKRLGLE